MVSFRLLEQTCFLQIMSCRRRTYYNPQPNFETSNADAAESEIRAKMPNSLREASEALSACSQPAQIQCRPKNAVAPSSRCISHLFSMFFFHVVCFGGLLLLFQVVKKSQPMAPVLPLHMKQVAILKFCVLLFNFQAHSLPNISC